MKTAETVLQTSLNEIDILKNEITQLKRQNAELQEQLAWFQRQIFGQRSERVVKDLDSKQPMFAGFDKIGKPLETEDTIDHSKAQSKRQKRKPTGKDEISLPEDIPTETIILDVDESEKTCPETGKPLVKIGEEITRKLACRPGSYFVKKYVRPKYASSSNPEAGISIATLPESLLDRCQADESFLSHILINKFANHIPLYRLSEMLQRDGVTISRQLLAKWVTRCGHALKPLYREMKKRILESNNVFMDESPIDGSVTFFL